MTNEAMKRIAPLLVRTALGLVFLYAGVIKILDPVAFAGSVAAYKVLPYGLNFLVAAVLPPVETLCGLLLIVGYRVRAASAIIIAMNIVFIVLLASAMVRGLDIDCGCFRQGGEKTPPWLAIARDILFLAGAIYLIRQPEKGRGGERPS